MGKPPSELAWWAVLVLEYFGRKANVPPSKLWDYATGKREPPPELAAALAEAFSPLQPSTGSVPYLGTMQPTTERKPRKPAGRPLDEGHPFTRALARSRLTVTEWAEDHGYSRETVKHWYADEGRPIPRTAAETIEKEYPEVKASPRTWRNGIKD